MHNLSDRVRFWGGGGRGVRGQGGSGGGGTVLSQPHWAQPFEPTSEGRERVSQADNRGKGLPGKRASKGPRGGNMLVIFGEQPEGHCGWDGGQGR